MPFSPDLSAYALKTDVPNYVSSTRMHVADVLANYPASAQYRGILAKVDDLFGALDGTLRCGFDGTRYFWQPNGLPDYYNGPQSVAADMTLTALGSPTIVNLTGTIGVGVNRKVTLATNDIWPGARKRIITNGVTSLLGTLQMLSGVSGLLSLAVNSTYDVAADYSSGAGQWVRV